MSDEDRQTDRPSSCGVSFNQILHQEKERVAGDLHGWRHSEGENYDEFFFGKNTGKTKKYLKSKFFRFRKIF